MSEPSAAASAELDQLLRDFESTLDSPALHHTLPAKLKAIQSHSHYKTTIGSNNAAFIAQRVHYHDALTDYQYLVQNLDYSKFGDLINKKILLYNSIPPSLQDQLGHNLNHKIVQLLVVSCSDFRRYNVLVYLKQNLPPDVDESTNKVYELISSQKLVPLNSFEQFLKARASPTGPGYHRLFSETLQYNLVLENWMENNLLQLSKYYRSVRISKIYDIFRNPPHVQVEEILVRMIVSNKLPEGSRIDQLKGVLVFGTEENESQDGSNKDIAAVGKLLNEICSQIEARAV